MLTESDRQRILDAYKVWPQLIGPYSHPNEEPGYTERLEQFGEDIRNRGEAALTDAPRLRKFLIDVGVWKMPRDREQHQAHVSRNTDESIRTAFGSLLTAYVDPAMDADRRRVAACTSLVGFGHRTGQTRMASTALRFIWPEEYGVIDWRNWAVLSNCEHPFLSVRCLPMLADTRRGLKVALYDVERYLEYLAVLRRLGESLGLERMADVDLALYAYSAQVWPFPRLDMQFDVLKSTLGSDVSEKQRRQGKRLRLHEIYETYWNEWSKLGDLPLGKQRDEKIDFLWMCLDITPQDIMVWDSVTEMRLPYHQKHRRDLNDLAQKVASFPPRRAVEELDAFMWHMRLKGEGHGVIV